MRILNLCRIAALGLLLSPKTAFGEPTLPDPGGRTEKPFTEISGSDYGPRNFDKQTDKDTNPHIGIDYRIQDSIKGLAVTEGTVNNVRIVGSKSYIYIGDWLYIHIATSTRLCSLYTSTGTNVVVLREEVNGVLRINSVLGEKTNNKDFYDPVTQTSKVITTSVSTGAWVFLAHPKVVLTSEV